MKSIIISALVAAIISIFSGIIGGVDFLSILIRAFVILIIFSFFAAVVNIIVSIYLKSNSSSSNAPEEKESEPEGSRVNIVLTEDDDAVSVEGFESEFETQNENLLSGKTENADEVQPREKERKLSDQRIFSSMEIDTLPDLDTFTPAFASKEEKEEETSDSGRSSVYVFITGFSSGSRYSAEGLAGTIGSQNSPEDLAKAVKTVLKREETD